MICQCDASKHQIATITKASLGFLLRPKERARVLHRLFEIRKRDFHFFPPGRFLPGMLAFAGPAFFGAKSVFTRGYCDKTVNASSANRLYMPTASSVSKCALNKSGYMNWSSACGKRLNAVANSEKSTKFL